MWIVCYIDEQERNKWTPIYRDEYALYQLLKGSSYFDEQGNLLFDEIHIFKDGHEIEDVEDLYQTLKAEIEENAWEEDPSLYEKEI